MDATRYSKHFVPLESNPDVFTRLAHDLGASSVLRFQDVPTLEEPALFPRPAIALILIFPTSTSYEAQRAKEEADDVKSPKERIDMVNVVWFKQTINNACGLYAILHAVCNGPARKYIRTDFSRTACWVELMNLGPRSYIARLIETCLPLDVAGRALELEKSEELEALYATAASEGDTSPPLNPEDEVDFHFVCFALSETDSHIYLLDGDRIGPVSTGVALAPGDDMLSSKECFPLSRISLSVRKLMELVSISWR